MEVLIIFIFLLVLAIAARHWGFDSTDSPESPEWEHRRYSEPACIIINEERRRRL